MNIIAEIVRKIKLRHAMKSEDMGTAKRKPEPPIKPPPPKPWPKDEEK